METYYTNWNDYLIVVAHTPPMWENNNPRDGGYLLSIPSHGISVLLERDQSVTYDWLSGKIHTDPDILNDILKWIDQQNLFRLGISTNNK